MRKSMDENIISEIAARIVYSFTASYVYDPEHLNRPSGAEWRKTDRGWSNNPKRAIDVNPHDLSLSIMKSFGFPEEAILREFKSDDPSVFYSVPRIAKNGNLKRIVRRSGNNVNKVVSAIRGVTKYVQDRYSKINSDLRAGKTNKDAENLLKMFQIGPKNKKDFVFRGITVNETTFNQIRPGFRFKDKGFVSTSENKNLASGFALWHHKDKRQAALLLNISGAKNKGLSIYSLRGVKQISENNEVVLPPDTELEVVSVSSRPFSELRKMYPYSDKNFHPEGYVEGDVFYDVNVKVVPLIAGDDDIEVPLFSVESENEFKLILKRLYEPMVIIQA